MSRWIALVFRPFAACVLLSLAGLAQAGEAKVENYSNDTIYVAVAYNQFQGNLAAEGWFAIKSNDTRTFSAADNADLHLHIKNSRGNAINFPQHQTFHDWPTEAERFSVSREPDDSKIRVMKWGANLENSRNINRGDQLPKGWKELRFFRIGAQKTKLEVRP